MYDYSLLFTCRGLFFGDYMLPGADIRVYDEISVMKELTGVIEKYVYNILKPFIMPPIVLSKRSVT